MKWFNDIKCQNKFDGIFLVLLLRNFKEHPYWKTADRRNDYQNGEPPTRCVQHHQKGVIQLDTLSTKSCYVERLRADICLSNGHDGLTRQGSKIFKSKHLKNSPRYIKRFFFFNNATFCLIITSNH